MKKLNLKRKIQKMGKTIIINYEGIINVVAPILFILLVVAILFLVDKNIWGKIKDFFIYQRWRKPNIERQDSSNSAEHWVEDPDVVPLDISDIPDIPSIDEKLPTEEIALQLKSKIEELDESFFSTELIEKLKEKTEQEITEENEETIRQDLIDTYNLLEEMIFAYQNKLNRYHESTGSAEN